ncbi:hypothetical protein GOBAR_DD16936 [Gossypium barbadense]|nr:hypothetical protein GOBAR_DD16936 [Gossypium barbadense]
MWPDLIRKAKEGGLDAVETYVFWNAHEPTRGQYDFSGNLDLIRFLKTIQDQGLYAILRIGPYTCAEWNYGGFPVWLHNMPGVSLRTKNDVFMLHDVLHSIEYILTNGDVKNEKLGNLVMATIYETKEKSSCFLSNTNTKIDANVNFGGINYFVPAWSISILPDCREEAYNTAKVSAQTSLMIKKLNKAEDEPSSLKWMWRPELIESTSVQGRGDVSVNKIVDQKDMANDASDYLWYMTSLGRYWPSYIADKQLCKTETCDYRGRYSDSKCVSKCGEPTQRWYHVPRSFLKDSENTLVLFEEFGGNPSGVQFQTVEIGSVCINTHEGKEVELSCQDRPISKIKFASFGSPQGVCGSFDKSEFDSEVDALSILEKECLGKESCSFKITEEKFGRPSCEVKKLVLLLVHSVIIISYMLAMIGWGEYGAAFDLDSIEVQMNKLFSKGVSTVLANSTIDAFDDHEEIEPFQFRRYQGSFPDNLKGILGDLSSFTMDLKIQRAKDIPLDSVLAKRQLNLLTAQTLFSEHERLEEKARCKDEHTDLQHLPNDPSPDIKCSSGA